MDSSTEDIFFINDGDDQLTEYPGVYFQQVRYRLPSKYQIIEVMGGGDLLRGFDKDSGRMVRIRHLPDPFSEKKIALSLLKDLIRHVSCFNNYPFFIHLNDVVIPQKKNASRLEFTEVFLVYEMMIASLNDVINGDPLGMTRISQIVTQMLIAMSFVDKMSIPFTLDHPSKIVFTDYSDWIRLGVEDVLSIDDHLQIPHLPLEEDPPCYLSREVISGDDSTQADELWSFGCILDRLITRAHLVSQVDPMAIHFLSCLLRLSPKERISLQGALEHPWVVRCISEHPEWVDVLSCIKTATLTQSMELQWRLSGIHLGLTVRRMKGIAWKEVQKIKVKDIPDGSDMDDRDHHPDDIQVCKCYIAKDFADTRLEKRGQRQQKHMEKTRRRPARFY